ncbi:MAG: hypothetical protein J2P36_40065, partial [Ktedonobacteraceae bacterium]|nr:hypothetical protein [Ktedonobacteraceae bacterium]
RSRQDVVDLVSEMEGHYETLYYIKETLALLDDKDLLILDPLNKRGFLTRLVGVQDRMYHCYALLQHALLEHAGPGYLNARPTDSDLVRYAQNRGLTTQDYREFRGRYDEQRFGFYYPGASQADGKINSLAFFPGSASFFDVPVIDGIPVLLVGEKFMSFSWEPANMYPVLHAALQSQVSIVSELPREEVETWLQRFSRPA